MANRAKLIQYQAMLLELLDSGLCVQEIRERLLNNHELAEYREYISEFDEEMLAVGKELVAKWSERCQPVD